MFLRTQIIAEKIVIGQSIVMSFSDNRTLELWREFMPERKTILNVLNSDLLSIEVYPMDFFRCFNPKTEFRKWAGVAVVDSYEIPEYMKVLIIPSGLYAVFLHKGKATEAEKTYQYIFSEWIPNSDYQLDNRPHFAVMGEKYQHDLADSEEEIWIPIK